jgi:glycosyltransferase involved in cell wall biosynthesis
MSKSKTLGVNLHIYPAPIVNASRIFKETESIAQSGLFSRIVICGTAARHLLREETMSQGRTIERIGAFVQGRPRSAVARIWEQLVWSHAVFRRYRTGDITVVNAHSVAVLPVSYLLSRKLGAKLVYDTHELETETSTSSGLQRRVFKFVERSLIQRCDQVFVVNESIASWYRSNYPGVVPVVVRNVPGVQKLQDPSPLRAVLGVPASKRLFIHVGNLTNARNIETILRTFASADVDDHVVFLGDGKLASLVLDHAQLHANIHHLVAVPPSEVLGHVAACDAALCLIEPTCLSYKLSLPNKAFEYAMAGVPFFYTDLPEVTNLLGPTFSRWCIDDEAKGLSAAIAQLTDGQLLDARRGLTELMLPSWEEESAAMMVRYHALIPENGIHA